MWDFTENNEFEIQVIEYHGVFIWKNSLKFSQRWFFHISQDFSVTYENHLLCAVWLLYKNCWVQQCKYSITLSVEMIHFSMISKNLENKIDD